VGRSLARPLSGLVLAVALIAGAVPAASAAAGDLWDDDPAAARRDQLARADAADEAAQVAQRHADALLDAAGPRPDDPSAWSLIDLAEITLSQLTRVRQRQATAMMTERWLARTDPGSDDWLTAERVAGRLGEAAELLVQTVEELIEGAAPRLPERAAGVEADLLGAELAFNRELITKLMFAEQRPDPEGTAPLVSRDRQLSVARDKAWLRSLTDAQRVTTPDELRRLLASHSLPPAPDGRTTVIANQWEGGGERTAPALDLPWGGRLVYIHGSGDGQGFVFRERMPSVRMARSLAEVRRQRTRPVEITPEALAGYLREETSLGEGGGVQWLGICNAGCPNAVIGDALLEWLEGDQPGRHALFAPGGLLYTYGPPGETATQVRALIEDGLRAGTMPPSARNAGTEARDVVDAYLAANRIGPDDDLEPALRAVPPEVATALAETLGLHRRWIEHAVQAPRGGYTIVDEYRPADPRFGPLGRVAGQASADVERPGAPPVRLPNPAFPPGLADNGPWVLLRTGWDPLELDKDQIGRLKGNTTEAEIVTLPNDELLARAAPGDGPGADVSATIAKRTEPPATPEAGASLLSLSGLGPVIQTGAQPDENP
jgi:hypothetical protein